MPCLSIDNEPGDAAISGCLKNRFINTRGKPAAGGIGPFHTDFVIARPIPAADDCRARLSVQGE
jgi:hypothetical protein